MARGQESKLRTAADAAADEALRLRSVAVRSLADLKPG